MIKYAGQLRAVVCLVVLAAAFSATPGQGAAELTRVPFGGFDDVSYDHWAYNEVMACLAADIVQGYGDGLYHPERAVTRGQMAVYISRAVAGGDASVPSGPAAASFPDIATDHWAYKYVEYAAAANVVTGYPGGNYRPDDVLNRGQMAVYIARAIVDPPGDAGLVNYTPPATASFPDVATDHWAYKYVEYCHAQSIAGGYPDGTYQPDREVTRDQMAAYVQRAFDLPMPAGPPAPDFTLQTLDGSQQYRLSDLRGIPVAVFFWTSWCPYSLDQASDLETLYQRYRDQDFLVLGVGLDDPTALQEEAEILGLTFPVGYNPDAGALYGVDAVPYTFIIDRWGSIASSWLGSQPIETMEAAVQAVL